MVFKQDDFTAQALAAYQDAMALVHQFQHSQMDVAHLLLALLRVRGASPWDLMGALVVQLYSPLFLSLMLGCVIGGLAGLGISHRVWDLQRVPTIMNLLKTELVFSWESVLVIIFIMTVLAVLVFLLGLWTFQKTAREAIRQE